MDVCLCVCVSRRVLVFIRVCALPPVHEYIHICNKCAIFVVACAWSTRIWLSTRCCAAWWHYIRRGLNNGHCVAFVCLRARRFEYCALCFRECLKRIGDIVAATATTNNTARDSIINTVHKSQNVCVSLWTKMHSKPISHRCACDARARFVLCTRLLTCIQSITFYLRTGVRARACTKRLLIQTELRLYISCEADGAQMCWHNCATEWIYPINILSTKWIFLGYSPR